MKKIFRISISGFNKIYRWIFNTAVRVRWTVRESALRMMHRLDKFSTTIKMKQTVAYLAPRLKEKFESVSSSFKLKTEIVIRTLERLKLETKIKIAHSVTELRIKLRVMTVVFDPIKFNLMKAGFEIRQFYKLRDWDYQIPDLPDSPKWKLSELDNMKLKQMDEK